MFRMRLLGSKVTGVDAGSRTLKDAIQRSDAGLTTNVRTTHYVLGSVLGASLSDDDPGFSVRDRPRLRKQIFSRRKDGLLIV